MSILKKETRREISSSEFVMTIYLSNESYRSLVLIRQLNTAWLFVFVFKSSHVDDSGLRSHVRMKTKKRVGKEENNKSITRFWYDDKNCIRGKYWQEKLLVLSDAAVKNWVRFQFALIYKSNREENKTLDLLGNRFGVGTRAVEARVRIENRCFFCRVLKVWETFLGARDNKWIQTLRRILLRVCDALDENSERMSLLDDCEELERIHKFQEFINWMPNRLEIFCWFFNFLKQKIPQECPQE